MLKWPHRNFEIFFSEQPAVLYNADTKKSVLVLLCSAKTAPRNYTHQLYSVTPENDKLSL